ncbi:MAG: hypothetical protein ACI4GV_08150 [Acutalibacteraceae bacterium]
MALSVSNLCKEYSDFKLDNVSFHLPKGYIMGLVGKTVLENRQQLKVS